MNSFNDFARHVLIPRIQRQQFRANFRDAVRREQFRSFMLSDGASLVGFTVNIRKPARYA